MQAPIESSVTIVPETVQTAVVCELKATVKPEVELALTLNGADPNG